MRQIYFTKMGDEPVLEVKAAESVSPGTIATWLREAADCLSGDTKTCGDCSQIAYKHQGFVCQSCGGVNVPRLTLVKGRHATAVVGGPLTEASGMVAVLTTSDFGAHGALSALTLEGFKVAPLLDLNPPETKENEL